MENVILGLFTQEIGKSFLDSGSAYGYAYERNRERDLLNEPLVLVDGGLLTINTAKFLIEELELSQDDVCHSINKVLRKQNIHWVSEIDEEFIEDYIEDSDKEITLMGDLINTYNHESHFDTVLIYRYIIVNGEFYILLQVHGGADVRGGYTDVICFKTDYFMYAEIYGTYKGREVSSMGDGYNLRYEDGNQEIDLDEIDEDELSLNIYREEIYEY